MQLPAPWRFLLWHGIFARFRRRKPIVFRERRDDSKSRMPSRPQGRLAGGGSGGKEVSRRRKGRDILMPEFDIGEGSNSALRWEGRGESSLYLRAQVRTKVSGSIARSWSLSVTLQRSRLRVIAALMRRCQNQVSSDQTQAQLTI